MAWGGGAPAVMEVTDGVFWPMEVPPSLLLATPSPFNKHCPSPPLFLGFLIHSSELGQDCLDLYPVVVPPDWPSGLGPMAFLKEENTTLKMVVYPYGRHKDADTSS